MKGCFTSQMHVSSVMCAQFSTAPRQDFSVECEVCAVLDCATTNCYHSASSPSSDYCTTLLFSFSSTNLFLNHHQSKKIRHGTSLPQRSPPLYLLLGGCYLLHSTVAPVSHALELDGVSAAFPVAPNNECCILSASPCYIQ